MNANGIATCPARTNKFQNKINIEKSKYKFLVDKIFRIKSITVKIVIRIVSII